VEVTVKLPLNIARALRGRAPPMAKSSELAGVIDSLGVKMEPLHPDAETPELMSYFKITTSSREVAQHVIDAIQQREEVEAAYIKPPDEMP
jgi:hypothetical protein